MDKDDLKHLKKKADKYRKMISSGNKNLSIENAARVHARRSIVAACDIKAGEKLTKANLIVKRPGHGISPLHWDDVVGKKSIKNIKNDELLIWGSLSKYIKSIVFLLILPVYISYSMTAIGSEKIDTKYCGLKQDTARAQQNLHVTIDVTDDMWRARRRLTEEDIYELMKYLASLGITRVYWMLMPELQNIAFAFSGTGTPQQTLAMVVNVAHNAGLEMYAVFKPFETSPFLNVVPHFVSLPPGISTMETIMGYNFNTVPFIYKHPELRVKRRLFSDGQQTSVAMIKLVSDSVASTEILPNDIEIWLSNVNGNFVLYKDGYLFSNTLSHRNDKQVRVLTFNGLSITSEFQYILIKCLRRTEQGTFFNSGSKLVEMYSSDGKPILLTVDQGVFGRDSVISKIQRMLLYYTGKWEIPFQYQLDNEYGKSLEKSSFYFDRYCVDNVRSLDGRACDLDGYITVAKGKPTHLNILQPLYPEVRAYWLRQIQTFIDAGVDGVDIRVCNHSSSASEPLEYGFGPSVIDAYRHKHNVNILQQQFDVGEWKRMQGNAYTKFLYDSRKLTSRYNVKMQVHVNALMGASIPYWQKNNLPANIEWQWIRWIREDLIDGVMLKYLPWPWGTAKGSGELFAEDVIREAKTHGKSVSWEWRLDLPPLKRDNRRATQADLSRIIESSQWGWGHPDLNAINIYEGFDFTYMKPEGGLEKSQVFEEILFSLRENIVP